jgi:hypothetical protein
LQLTLRAPSGVRGFRSSCYCHCSRLSNCPPTCRPEGSGSTPAPCPATSCPAQPMPSEREERHEGRGGKVPGAASVHGGLLVGGSCSDTALDCGNLDGDVGRGRRGPRYWEGEGGARVAPALPILPGRDWEVGTEPPERDREEPPPGAGSNRAAGGDREEGPDQKGSHRKKIIRGRDGPLAARKKS